MENSKTNGIDGPEGRGDEEDEEEEEKKMEMFFALIRNYQEARKREREERAEYSGEQIRNPKKRSLRSDGGGRTGIVPAFRPEDFARDLDLTTRPPLEFPARREEKKTEEEVVVEKEEKEETDVVGLDLNLAL